jgi:peptidoglycan-associated lipoprotein
MRSILFLISFLFIESLIMAQSSPSSSIFMVEYTQEHIDLGEVKKGEKVSFQYELTNTGSETVEIEIVSGCECTTLDWPRKEIKPGVSGIIDVVFDSTEKEESETVDVDITFKNTDENGNQRFKILTYSFELIQ